MRLEEVFFLHIFYVFIKEITFFKSVGMAVQDIAVAKHILKKAEKGNLGTVL